MSDNQNQNLNNITDEIDLVDFSANQEMDKIRENERKAREIRIKRVKEMRKAEYLRQKKIERLKQTFIAWTLLIVAVAVVISLVTTVISLVTRESTPEELSVGDTLSSKEMKIVEKFATSDKTVYGAGNAKALDEAVDAMIVSGANSQSITDFNSYLGLFASAYCWNSFDIESGGVSLLKQYVAECPLYANGYVWSAKNSMKSAVTGAYLYDTNAAFIKAVSEICLWEGDISFLSTMDMTGESNGDISKNMTVGEKLEKVVSHFFDETDYLNGGGVRYNKNDNLVYVYTKSNNGTNEGKPSNIFFNHRFGYLDLYNNLAFYDAMQSLSHMYKLSGDAEKAKQYENIALANKTAVNNKFYDTGLGRYIGCIDASGKIHDGGFVSLNLMALSLDIAEGDKKASIEKWLSGERKVSTDTLDSEGIFKNALLPAFSTVTATDSWWDYRDGNYPISGDASFGNYWQNGKQSAICGYFDLLRLSKKDTKTRAEKIAKAYADNQFVLPEKDEKNYSEPAIHYSAYVSGAVKNYFGISTDGKVLSIEPTFNIDKSIGIKDIRFDGKEYSVLFDYEKTYILSNIEDAVRVKMSGFEKGQDVIVTIITGEKITSSETHKADENGVLTLSKKFGNDSFIKLERVITQEKE